MNPLQNGSKDEPNIFFSRRNQFWLKKHAEDFMRNLHAKALP